MNINTQDVLEAAGTKWNFLPFKPGLVGGHCIGVDPYYLSQKAQEFGYNPEIILAGRRMNDSMGNYVANEVVKLMIKKNVQVKNSSILILGFTFKENCPDIRNTRVIDIYKSLKDFEIDIDVYDPWANSNEVKKEFNFELIDGISKKYSAIILAVAHNDFSNLNTENYLNEKGVIYDVKGTLNKNIVDGTL